MSSRAFEEWTFEQLPTSRSMRMPRATGQLDQSTSDVTVSTIHSRPVLVADDATTMSLEMAFLASGPSFTSLEVFAGAAFEAFSAATDALRKVASNVALEKQLNSLSIDFYEDFGKPLDQDSIAGLRHFLLVHQDVAPPDAISADQSGQVEATWQAAHGQSASLKFLDDEKFHYALVVETPSGRKRPWGTAGRFEVFVARPEARTILGEGSSSSLPPT